MKKYIIALYLVLLSICFSGEVLLKTTTILADGSRRIDGLPNDGNISRTMDSVHTGSVLRYTFKYDDNSGTNYYDLSKLENNGYSTVPSQQPAHITTDGEFYDFDGIDSKISIDENSSIDNYSKLSVSVWIYPYTSGEGGFGRIVNKQNSGGSGGYSLFIIGNNAGYTNTLEWLVDYTTSDTTWVMPNESVSYSTWTHVVVTHDSGNITNAPRFYLNGLEVSAIVRTAGVGSRISDASNPLVIGNKPDRTRT